MTSLLNLIKSLPKVANRSASATRSQKTKNSADAPASHKERREVVQNRMEARSSERLNDRLNERINEQTMDRCESGSSPISLHYPIADTIPAAERVDPIDVFQVLRDVAAEFGERMKRVGDRRAKVRLVLSGPSHISIPILVRAELGVLRAVVRSFVAQAIQAANGGEGVVRIHLRVALGSLIISVEDNGRGLSEELLAKLAAKSVGGRAPDTAPAFWGDVWCLQPKDARKLLSTFGARMDLLARLGVGTRVVIEIPRLDAYSIDSLSRHLGQDSKRFGQFQTGGPGQTIPNRDPETQRSL
jgi:hypothetical protein